MLFKKFTLPFVVVSLLLASNLPGQSCPSCRYISPVFDSVVVSTEKFGEGMNANGNQQELFMDIYEPYGDTLAQRPLIVFAFGGGFIQGSRDEEYIQRGCRRFARAGYVAASIDYRIGFSIPGLFPNPTAELMRVFFRAMQDMRGATQWFRANEDLLGNTYRIDPNMVMIGGASSGAITALLVAYCDDAVEFSAIADSSSIAGLGGFYSSSGLYPGYSWEPQAVLNIAGAIVDTDWIEAGDPPVLSAHGDEDLIVPYQGGNANFGFATLGLEGSYLVDQAATNLGICSYLYTIEGGDHPSRSEDEEYFDQIYMRALPRMEAVVHGRSYCCPLTAEIQPYDTIFATMTPGSAPDVELGSSGGGSNPGLRWCGVRCDAVGAPFAPDAIPYADAPGYLIGIAQEGNCQATDFIPVLRVPVGVDAPENAVSFTVAPNPATNRVLLRMGNRLPGRVEFRLLSLQGVLLKEFSVAGASASLDVSEVPAGVYLLELRHTRGTFTQKLLIQ